MKEEEIESFQMQRSKNFAPQFIKGEKFADSLLKTLNKMYLARGDFNLFLRIAMSFQENGLDAETLTKGWNEN